MEQYLINSFDGTPLNVKVWNNVQLPKGLVQIAHGSYEHSGRYTELAELLEANGYIVFCNDLRALGETELKNNLGYHDGNIFRDSFQDLIFLNNYFKEIYKIPSLLIGTGYGSFLAQALLTKGIEYNGIILSGTALIDIPTSLFASAVTKLLPKRKKANIVAKSHKNALNSAFPSEKGDCLWATKDEKKRIEYLNDPLCNATLYGNFYYSFSKGVAEYSLNGDDNNRRLDTPIAIFSGRHDPVGGKKSSKAIKLYKFLRKKGYKCVRLFIYENARHYIISEVDREVYMNHYLTFINRCFGLSEHA